MSTIESTESLLHQVAIYDNLDLLITLLDGPEKQYINTPDEFGRTPLYVSVAHNSFQCCQILLLTGANPDICCGLTCGGQTALHVAVSQNKVNFVRLLLDNYANINLYDNNGLKPMDIAEKNSYLECVQIISSYIDFYSLRKKQYNKLLIDSCLLGDLKAFEEILELGRYSKHDIISLVESFSNDEDVHDLLYVVVRNNHRDICEKLLTFDLKLRVEPSSGLSPIHLACLIGNTSCLELLIKYYPDHLFVTTLEGSLPIHLGCMQSHLNVVQFLINVFHDPSLFIKLMPNLADFSEPINTTTSTNNNDDGCEPVTELQSHGLIANKSVNSSPCENELNKKYDEANSDFNDDSKKKKVPTATLR